MEGIGEVLRTWWFWVLMLVLIGLIGLLIYVRKQQRED
jgi:type II secretory pathway component PulF